MLVAGEGVGDQETEVVVLNVADHLVHVFQSLGHLLLPGARIGDDVRDVALVGARSCRCRAWCRNRRSASSRPCRRASEDRQEPLFSAVGSDDGLVDAFGSIVGVFDQQQQLRKGVVLAASRNRPTSGWAIASSRGRASGLSMCPADRRGSSVRAPALPAGRQPPADAVS